MQTLAVVIEEPERLSVRSLELIEPGADDIVVDVTWSGISTGTERLLWTGRMPPFPGMGYPLVPGYESVGLVVEAGASARARIGETVFVPGSSGFKDARGLFGGAARRLVAASARAPSISAALGEEGVLIALAATARHAIAAGDGAQPDLIVGHGVLGRLLARLAVGAGGPPPTVWETNPVRQSGAEGYLVVHPDDDPRRDYRSIYDVSGDSSLLGPLISRLARGGEVVLAGFYDKPLSFDFPPAFMREARLRVAAEWTPPDLAATTDLIASGRLSLSGLITHQVGVAEADRAYRTAFGDPACLKMVLDWRQDAGSPVPESIASVHLD
jgi:3-hydroxyethyl bacteriochlorophyllide a dehydrogenase